MGSAKDVLLIDAGNSIVKLCRVENGQLGNVIRCDYESLSNQIEYLGAEALVKVCSSVLSEADMQKLSHNLRNVQFYDAHISSPLSIHYLPINSLGFDRLCNANAIQRLTKSDAAVSVDIGTCIKFDLVVDKKYLGGSISPGIELRYKAMHAFTGKLPLINSKDAASLTGNSTSESMHSGVINGIQAEIEGMMRSYRKKYNSITFFVTGGDSSSFDFEGKNDIFVRENLTLEGLYTIYSYNAL
jgi:type III pantothenate kinase